jgi:DNA-binding XRE family transcriptional regulator
MRSHCGRVLASALVVGLAACTSTPSGAKTAASIEPSTGSFAPASSSEQPRGFPIGAFADISGDPVSKETAGEFQAVLDDLAGGGGMAAMPADLNRLAATALPSVAALPSMLADDRKRAGWSVEQAARRLAVSAATYREIEAGMRVPAWKRCDRICKLFGWLQTFAGIGPTGGGP